jgi:hypothetical protein
MASGSSACSTFTQHKDCRRQSILRSIGACTRIAGANRSQDRLQVRVDFEGDIAGFHAQWLEAHSYNKPAHCQPMGSPPKYLARRRPVGA